MAVASEQVGGGMFEAIRALGASPTRRPPPCAVCGRPMVGEGFAMTDGRVWCADHARLPRCRWCGIPLLGRVPVTAADVCADCARTAVASGRDVVPAKDLLKQQMSGLGIVVEHPTRIQLVAVGALGPAGGQVDSHQLGTTSWTTRNGRIVPGPITIQVLRGLPLPRFRHVIAHEFGHAALAGSRSVERYGPRLLEGFAESVAVVHLRALAPPETHLVDSVLSNPDPVYGGGARLVLTAVDQHGLLATWEALRQGRPESVGLGWA